MNVLKNNKKYLLLWLWVIRGGIYTLPVNFLTLLTYIVLIRFSIDTPQLEMFFASPMRMIWMFRSIVFGIPALIFFFLMLFRFSSIKQRSFFLGATIIQLLLFFLITPRFDM